MTAAFAAASPAFETTSQEAFPIAATALPASLSPSERTAPATTKPFFNVVEKPLAFCVAFSKLPMTFADDPAAAMDLSAVSSPFFNAAAKSFAALVAFSKLAATFADDPAAAMDLSAAARFFPRAAVNELTFLIASWTLSLNEVILLFSFSTEFTMLWITPLVLLPAAENPAFTAAANPIALPVACSMLLPAAEAPVPAVAANSVIFPVALSMLLPAAENAFCTAAANSVALPTASSKLLL
ncbi:MAG TPA: hypothetical protein P5075_08165 [Eubacteriales bacterium]|nr:hypothetical protein [Eubacteriales bacterium]